ncbi:MAG TPA: GTP cyclohydrolase II, partial [Spirochaetota bacterium]|nr:GTP cyclohydrolase II [Spirochaetota bacterium]
QAEKGGVLKRAGHTEAAVDLAVLAGLKPGGVICEIIKDDGHMARYDDLQVFAGRHNLKIIKIQDLIKYRLRHDNLVTRVGEADLPTKYGKFKLIAYANQCDEHIHMALVKGDVKNKKGVLVRVHSECFTGDVFGSLRCDCGEQLARAMQIIEKNGCGVILYLRQEGRGIGLVDKIKAYHLQERGMDTVEANLELGHKPDLRDYGIGACILRELGLSSIKLLTNNPKKIIGLKGYGLEVLERMPIVIKANANNTFYLETKEKRMGHIFENK